MRITRKLLVVVLTFFALATSAHAQSPREQLNLMVQQLQKTPNDNALREKIIKLARTMKPSPSLPDSAVAFEGRAQFAFRNAKSEVDFLAAAQEYEKAVTVAPWVLGYYVDLCTIYEKAGKYEDAKRHCGFYLIGLTDSTQMTDVKRRIAGLEFGIEKTKEKLRTTVGDWYNPEYKPNENYYRVIQRDGRFEVQHMLGGRQSCMASLEATATTIKFVSGTYNGSTEVCGYGSGGHGQCRLSGETILDCQVRGYGDATGMDSSYQLHRR